MPTVAGRARSAPSAKRRAAPRPSIANWLQRRAARSAELTDAQRAIRNALGISTALTWVCRAAVVGFALAGAVGLGLFLAEHWSASPETPRVAEVAAAAHETAPVAATPVDPPVQAPAAVAETPSAAPIPQAVEAAATRADPSFEAARADAEDALKAQLPNPYDLLYRNVRTMLWRLNGRQMVDFCGEVNSKTPTGAYGGFQRFISSSSGADLERAMTPGEFSQDWLVRCSGSEGPPVWR